MGRPRENLADFGLRPDQQEALMRLLRHAVPENRLRSYDVREVGRLIVDVGSWLELRPDFGQAYVTALARIADLEAARVAALYPDRDRGYGPGAVVVASSPFQDGWRVVADAGWPLNWNPHVVTYVAGAGPARVAPAA